MNCRITDLIISKLDLLAPINLNKFLNGLLGTSKGTSPSPDSNLLSGNPMPNLTGKAVSSLLITIRSFPMNILKLGE